MALTDKLTAIADAIREKTGKTDGMTLEQMPGEIAGIQSGGDTSAEDNILERTLTSYRNDRITKLGDRALSGNTALTEVSLPNVITVGKDGFSECTALTEVSLPNAETLGNYTFTSCTALIEISLPNVTILPAHAFENSGLRTFFFPKLTKIESYGLARTQVESITTEDLPALESWGGDYCMANNSKLKYFQHTLTISMSKRNFQSCGALEKVDTHTDGLYYYAFSGCSSLNTLILRRTDAICAFGNTNALTNTPIVNGTGFVYVPRALLEEYRQATNWSSLLPEQFRAIEDYPEICEVGV